MSKRSVFRFSCGSGHCSESQKDREAVLSLQEWDSFVFIMIVIFPFSVVWAILWEILNGNVEKVPCCFRCHWKWSNSAGCWRDGWCTEEGGRAGCWQQTWFSERVFASKFCLTLHYCEAACMYFIKWRLQFLQLCNLFEICFRAFSLSVSDSCQTSATAGKLCFQESLLQQRNRIVLFKTMATENDFQTLGSGSEEQGMGNGTDS